MFEITIPGDNTYQISHLVFDYNGTLAEDGILIAGVINKLKTLTELVEIHVLTADTFGSVEKQLQDIPCQVTIIPMENQHISKLNYVSRLGVESTICVGNGRNDRLMLKKAAIGIAIIQGEGVATETMLAADIAVFNILSALDLLLHPLRLKATLRS